MSIETIEFAVAMQKKLNLNCHKLGWEYLSDKWLINRIRQETKEIETAIRKKKPVTEIQAECADVANFAMMLWDNWSRREYEDPPKKKRGKR